MIFFAWPENSILSHRFIRNYQREKKSQQLQY